MLEIHVRPHSLAILGGWRRCLANKNLGFHPPWCELRLAFSAIPGQSIDYPEVVPLVLFNCDAEVLLQLNKHTFLAAPGI